MVKFNKTNFVYIPSLKLYIAKERTHFGESWYGAHRLLSEAGYRMPTINEFREFLRYIKNHKKYYEVYKNNFLKPSSRVSEWLNADFKVKGKKMHLNDEILDKNTLMKGKKINFDDWLNHNYTSQGLPSKKVKKGTLNYLRPNKDNVSVAGFVVTSEEICLGCWGPHFLFNSNGVRPVKKSKKFH